MPSSDTPPHPPEKGAGTPVTFTDKLIEGTRPRSVTAGTARRCKLWRHGTLLIETAFGTNHVVDIDSQMVAALDPVEANEDLPWGQQQSLSASRVLVFIPNGH